MFGCKSASMWANLKLSLTYTQSEKILHGILSQYFAKGVMSSSLQRGKLRCSIVLSWSLFLSPQSVDRISNKTRFVDHNPVLLSTVQFI